MNYKYCCQKVTSIRIRIKTTVNAANTFVSVCQKVTSIRIRIKTMLARWKLVD